MDILLDATTTNVALNYFGEDKWAYRPCRGPRRYIEPSKKEQHDEICADKHRMVANKGDYFGRGLHVEDTWEDRCHKH